MLPDIWSYLKKYIVPGVLIGVIVALLLGLPSLIWDSLSDLRTDGVSATSVYTFRGADPRYQLAEAEQGECWTTGIASGRVDSWRCSVGHFIYDPCFGAPFGVADIIKVICPRDPSDASSIIAVEFPRSSVDWDSKRASVRDEGVPWFFTTYDGHECLRLTGTRPDSPFGFLPFQCGSFPRDPRSDDSKFCTEPKEIGETWTAKCLPYFETDEVETVVVSELWY